MASNAQTKDITVGAWEFFIGATSLGLIANDDVEIEGDPNLIKSQVMAAGEATVKVFTGGTNLTVTVTLAGEHKAILRKVYGWLSGNNFSLTDGKQGSIDINSAVGDVVPTYPLTGYCNFWDDNGVFYGNDALNPHSIQLYKAFSAETIKWMFSSSDNSTHEITFEALADLDKPKNAVGKYGFVTLPLASVMFANVTNGGTGYTSAPTVTVGTQFAATTAYTLNQQVAHLGNLYTVTTAGTSGAIGTAPINTSGTATSGTAVFTYVGSAATAQASIASGSVVSLQIINAGSGYTSNPTVAFSGGAGSGAVATAQIG